MTLFLCSPCSRFRGLCFGPGGVSHLPSAPRHSHQDRSFASSSSRWRGGEGCSACQCSSELNPSSCRRPVCFPPDQVLLFPALSFIQAGRLSSLEFVSRELSSQTHVWLQIYRPHCPHRGLRLLLPSKSIRQTRLAGHSRKVLTEIYRPAVATHARTPAACRKLLLVNMEGLGSPLTENMPKEKKEEAVEATSPLVQRRQHSKTLKYLQWVFFNIVH